MTSGLSGAGWLVGQLRPVQCSEGHGLLDGRKNGQFGATERPSRTRDWPGERAGGRAIEQEDTRSAIRSASGSECIVCVSTKLLASSETDSQPARKQNKYKQPFVSIIHFLWLSDSPLLPPIASMITKQTSAITYITDGGERLWRL